MNKFLTLDRLGLYLIVLSSVLLGIWAVKDTIALRNILLVLGTLGSFLLIYKTFQIHEISAIKLAWTPAISIFLVILWVITHYFFFSDQSDQQWRELKSIWLRSMMASIFGLATGLALIQRPKLIIFCWAPILVGFFVLFAQYLPLALQSGQMVVPLNTEDFRRYLFIGKINPMYLGVLLIAGSTGALLDALFSGDRSWIKKMGIFWFICLLTALYSFAFIINTRSGILLGGLVIICWSIYGLIITLTHPNRGSLLGAGGARKLAYVFILALMLITIFGRQQMQLDSGWQQLTEDIKIGYQIEKYPHWQNHDLYGFPYTESGKLVTYNTYQRVAWATAGVKSIPNHPLGIGVLLLPLGVAAKGLFPEVVPLSTHSGWIDLALAFGIPGIALLWLANGSILYFAIRNSSPFRFSIITLAITLFALFTVGELSNGHNLEMLFYLFAMMTGTQIGQKLICSENFPSNST
jgi:hypothetical protein